MIYFALVLIFLIHTVVPCVALAKFRAHTHLLLPVTSQSEKNAFVNFESGFSGSNNWIFGIKTNLKTAFFRLQNHFVNKKFFSRMLGKRREVKDFRDLHISHHWTHQIMIAQFDYQPRPHSLLPFCSLTIFDVANK